MNTPTENDIDQDNKPKNDHSYYSHNVWIQDGKVYLANNEDGYYTENFANREEIDELIRKLEQARDECFPLPS